MKKSQAINNLRLKFTKEKAEVIRNIMLSATYRTSCSPTEKVKILLSSEYSISVQEACSAVGISTKTYYNCKAMTGQIASPLIKSSPNQLLTNDEEKKILQFIEKAQLNCDCYNGKGIRELAEQIFFDRTNERRQFNKNWYLTFMIRYQDVIDKQKCTSVDEDRGNISPIKIYKYIDDIKNALQMVTEPRLLINMDECGFGKRCNYKKRRTCIFIKKCKVPPSWKGTTDNYHVSWVCGITAGATHTRHMFITTRKTKDPEFHETFLSEFGEFTFSPKGYLIEANMVEWIQNHLIPYVMQIRSDIGNDDHPVVLLMDNLEQHFSEKVISELEKIKPYILVPLPPHSSHFTQPCDSCVFSSSKSRYKQIPYPSSTSKFVSKLLKVQQAIEQTFSKDTIIASWRHCGFNITIKDGVCTNVEFSKEFEEELRTMAEKKSTDLE